MKALFCIDSAMLHFGRLIGVSRRPPAGPTNPATRLRPDMVPGEEVIYRGIPCSPCIHVAERPPCNGASACMRGAAAIPEPVATLNPIWLVGVDSIASAKPAKVLAPQPSVRGTRLPVIGGDFS